MRGDTKYLGSWSYPDAIALAQDATGDDQFGYRAEAIKLMQSASAMYPADNISVDPSSLTRDTPMVQLGAFEVLGLPRLNGRGSAISLQPISRVKAGLFSGALRTLA